MSLLKRIEKIKRENYAVEFTVPVLFREQEEELAKRLKGIEDEEEIRSARSAFIEETHELRLLVTRLADREVKDAEKDAYAGAKLGDGVPVAFVFNYSDMLWTRIRRHVKSAVEKDGAGHWVPVSEADLKAYFDAIETHAVDTVRFIVRSYNEAVTRDREAARADPDFLDRAS